MLFLLSNNDYYNSTSTERTGTCNTGTGSRRITGQSTSTGTSSICRNRNRYLYGTAPIRDVLQLSSILLCCTFYCWKTNDRIQHDVLFVTSFTTKSTTIPKSILRVLRVPINDSRKSSRRNVSIYQSYNPNNNINNVFQQYPYSVASLRFSKTQNDKIYEYHNRNDIICQQLLHVNQPIQKIYKSSSSLLFSLSDTNNNNINDNIVQINTSCGINDTTTDYTKATYMNSRTIIHHRIMPIVAVTCQFLYRIGTILQKQIVQLSIQLLFVSMTTIRAMTRYRHRIVQQLIVFQSKMINLFSSNSTCTTITSKSTLQLLFDKLNTASTLIDTTENNVQQLQYYKILQNDGKKSTSTSTQVQTQSHTVLSQFQQQQQQQQQQNLQPITSTSTSTTFIIANADTNTDVVQSIGTNRNNKQEQHQQQEQEQHQQQQQQQQQQYFFASPITKTSTDTTTSTGTKKSINANTVSYNNSNNDTTRKISLTKTTNTSTSSRISATGTNTNTKSVTLMDIVKKYSKNSTNQSSSSSFLGLVRTNLRNGSTSSNKTSANAVSRTSAISSVVFAIPKLHQKIPIIGSLVQKYKISLSNNNNINDGNRNTNHSSLLVSSALLVPISPIPIIGSITKQQVLSHIRTVLPVIFQSMIGIGIVVLTIRGIRIHQRLQDDITSEWSRYAKNPSARGIAAMLLTFRVLVLYTIATICQNISTVLLSQQQSTTLLSKSFQRYTNSLFEYSGTIVTNGLLQLGPLYIKLGQIVSCQNNLVPVQWQTSMQLLQDQVPAWTGQRAKDLALLAWSYSSKSSTESSDSIQKSFDETFIEFDTTPIAAASLGQVHRAVLRKRPEHQISQYYDTRTTTTINKKVVDRITLMNNNGIALNNNNGIALNNNNGIALNNNNGIASNDNNGLALNNNNGMNVNGRQQRHRNGKSTVSKQSYVNGDSSSTTNTASKIETVPRTGSRIDYDNTDEEYGEVVAIKIQRPYLKEIYDNDLSFLLKIATTIDTISLRLKDWNKKKQRNQQRNSKQSTNTGSSTTSTSSDIVGIENNWTQIFTDARNILYREINYNDEANNGIRFMNCFGLGKNGTATIPNVTSRDGKVLSSAAEWLRAPYVYDKLSNERILVMEYVPSIKITNLVKLGQSNITAGDREYLADCLGRAYIRQFCCNNHFSTDPHPGNLGVEVINENILLASKNRVRLVFYDFGQAATISKQQGDGILDAIEAIIDSDVTKSIDAFQKMGILKDNANLTTVYQHIDNNYKTGKIKTNCQRLKKKGYNVANEQTPTATITNSTSNSTAGTNVYVMQYFTLPAEYAFVARALTQIDGVGKTLDNEFDFISAAAPWIYEIKGTNQYIQDEVTKLIDRIFKR